MKLKNKVLNSICIITMVISLLPVNIYGANGVYYGIDNSQEIINNVNFKDVSTPGYWAKDAIYKSAALSIIKGYGDDTFKPNNNITKAEALALIYRALGKEADAQKEGQTLQEARDKEEKKGNAVEVWAEGYLSLAQKDGLITKDEFDEATNPSLFLFDSKKGFDPDSPASRQEVAVWISKALKIEPIYSQNNLFNNFKDWNQIDEEKIPYIEALLKEKIMNGDNGYFYPKNTIKRAEMAQVIGNAESFILKANNLTKLVGFIQNISSSKENQPGKEINKKIIGILCYDGSPATLLVTGENNTISGKNSETGVHTQKNSAKDIVVNKDGKLGNSSILAKDDELELIIDKDNNVKYIQAKSVSKDSYTYYGSVVSVDADANKVTFNADNQPYTFPVSQQGVITINYEGKSLQDVPFGVKAYFTVAHNVVTRIEISNTKRENELPYFYGGSDARGIIGEINPNLNYLSLYSVDGKKDPKLLRTFNFSPKIEVSKDGVKTNINNIEVGDTAYLKFNENYGIEYINVESNNSSIYGEILAKGKDYLIVKKDDGTSMQLGFDESTIIVKNNDIISINDIMVGDIAKFTVNQNDKYSKIKGIKVEGEQHLITNIYRGKMYSINKEQLSVSNLKYFKKGKWALSSQRGIVNIDMDEECAIYKNNQLIDLSSANDSLQNRYVYFATYKDYGEQEKIIKICSMTGFEKIYNNEISGILSNKVLQLSNTNDNIKYNDTTIISKFGRLTDGQNIAIKNPVYIVGLRDSYTGDIMASIVQIENKPSVMGLDIYRGKISSIDEGKSFTVESFSILKGITWEFTNTPKTFDINSQTRILSSTGIVNNRDFIDYTDKTYKDKIVYIVVNSSGTQLISELAYGIINLKGEIYKITAPSSSTGKTVLTLKDMVYYNSNTGIWDSLGEGTINTLVNSIIIKNGKLIEGKELNIGDKIRIIKKDNTAAGDAFIILVEE